MFLKFQKYICTRLGCTTTFYKAWCHCFWAIKLVTSKTLHWIIWGNTYPTNTQPVLILQKRSIRIITFSKFDDHSSPLFKQTNILKLTDLITFHVSLFMFKFHNKLLPAVFDNYFISTSKVHNYNTRLSSQLGYSLPRVRTNYGKFNIKLSGSKVWNSLSTDLELLSIGSFKARLKSNLISRY